MIASTGFDVGLVVDGSIVATAIVGLIVTDVVGLLVDASAGGADGYPMYKNHAVIEQ